MDRKRNNIRKVSPRILVLCEGLTEKLYFSDIKATLSRPVQRDISVIISQAHETEPKKMLLEALRKQETAKKEKQPYKEIWLVFDDDNRRDLKSVFEKAKRNCINIAYSSISFEYWYFLHFNKKATVFKDSDSAKKVIEKHIPGYYETMPGIYNAIKGKYTTNALPNAKWLQKQMGYTDIHTAYSHKPITNVNELCEIILNFGK